MAATVSIAIALLSIVAVGCAVAWRRSRAHATHCQAELSRKQADFAAESSQQLRKDARNQSLLSASGTTLWTSDAAGNITERQAGWSRFTGQTWPHYQGQGWLEAIHEADRQHVREHWPPRELSGPGDPLHVRAWHAASGAYRQVALRAVPLEGDEAAPQGWIGTLREADDQGRSATELREAQEALAAANRAKNEFLANISHEVRTPIYAIVGMTELSLEEDLSTAVRENLETVKGSADVLLQLVNEILDFSKLESGKFELELGPFNFRHLVDETIKAMAVTAGEKGLELACDLAADVPEVLVGDALRLRQILTNLLSNAIKFSEQGEVVLRVAVDERSGERVSLRFEVTDTGIGISQDDQNRIFAPFTQVDSCSTRMHGGTGLGLAIVQELVRLMSGRLGVTSNLGSGSTFFFTLPLIEPRGGARVVASQGFAGLRVLAVDDNNTSRRILTSILRQRGIEPTLAADGPASLKLVKDSIAASKPFQVVLIDSRMPGMNGFALAEELGREPAIAPGIVMMMTSGDRQAHRAQCERLELKAHVEKPISEAALWEAIARVTGRRKAVGHAATLYGGSVTASQPRRVLLAEDTLANQKIVKNILAKRGHVVEIARNGREVLEMIREQPFDLILMDVQMPIMDGFQATGAIRSLEAHLDVRVPIVALTAHAMQGDRERCLAAGMDAYLVKPVSSAVLVELVESLSMPKNAPRAVGTESTADAMDIPEDAQLFDLEAALARLGNDTTFLGVLIQFFLEDFPVLLQNVRDAVARNDPPDVARAAHSLKGLVTNFDAHRVTRLADRIEKAGWKRDLPAAAQLLDPLERELERVRDGLLEERGRYPTQLDESREADGAA